MAYCYYNNDSSKVVCAPPKMADGRILTDYRSASLIDLNMQSKLNTANQYEYRQFLIENGNKITAQQRNLSESTIKVKKPKSKMVPERYLTICQGNRCEVREINPMGVGIGREATTNWTPIQPSDTVVRSKGSSLYKTIQ